MDKNLDKQNDSLTINNLEDEQNAATQKQTISNPNTVADDVVVDNNLNAEQNEDSANNAEVLQIVQNNSDLQENVSLGEFTDSAIVQGVVSSGVLGEKVEIPTSSKDFEEKQTLVNEDIHKANDEKENDALIASEFDTMSNVINGHKRKPTVKKKKKNLRVRKIVVRTYATILITVLSIVAVYYAITFLQVAPAQGMDGAALRVDMQGLTHYVGNVGEVDFNLMFPTGSDFKKNGAKIPEGKLKINNEDPFTLTYTEIVEEVSKTIQRYVEVKLGAVNVSDWDGLVTAIGEKKAVCIQAASISAPDFTGRKMKKDESLGLSLNNDLYGNGCKLNVYNLVTCRGKMSGSKLAAPYLQGNGKYQGFSAFTVRPVEDKKIILQDLHIIGNDMSTAEGGNLAGLSEEIIKKRGLNLFSNYGYLVNVAGNMKDGEAIKAQFRLEHCVLENGHQIIHVRNSQIEMEGNIIRNASDAGMSVATESNEASTISSKNNVIANAVTGGIVFYCYDKSITADNADNTWNYLIIEEGSFLDIYNWKEQSNLAFMPETEQFASVANPIAKGEIPNPKYDKLKAIINGKKYIHFAIIKLRTGEGLPMNGSVVENYQSLGYQTTKDKGYEKGFPLPSAAAMVIKDIDVWGYYNNDGLDVKPTDVLSEERLVTLYKELKEGRANVGVKK